MVASETNWYVILSSTFGCWRCTVLTTSVIPWSAAHLSILREISKDLEPSSMPGKTWLCKSIKLLLIKQFFISYKKKQVKK